MHKTKSALIKTIFFAALLLPLSGCVVAQIIDDKMAESSNAERRAREEKDKQAETRAKVLKVGVTLNEFVAVWGKPTLMDFLEDVHTAHYENDGKPILIYFKSQKLIGWKYTG